MVQGRWYSGLAGRLHPVEQTTQVSLALGLEEASPASPSLSPSPSLPSSAFSGSVWTPQACVELVLCHAIGLETGESGKTQSVRAWSGYLFLFTQTSRILIIHL